MKTMLDADCSDAKMFLARHGSGVTVADAIREAPGLVECLLTHERIPGAARSTLPGNTIGLRALGLNWADADLAGATLSCSRLRGINFTGARAAGFEAHDVVFVGCYFHGADFLGAKFTRCRFIHCELSKNDFREVRVSGCEFFECDLYANWAKGSNLPNDEAWWRGPRAPWDDGFCEGHELGSLAGEVPPLRAREGDGDG